jgi:DNA polymerase-3 subunit gamma/tau
LSYQVIARKWRPQSFSQLVGQNHISQTLTNALKNGRLPHALLFTGPRGTGKTSSARILAKALRCPNAVDFQPCNQCSECEEISVGRSANVMEIDGASNNGVDAIRELRDSVAYSPSSGRFKIYIIDEVHMLSTSAFNALLKTLEEPPEHVIFIMATTEVHKIPATILSRCQRFDFRRIPTRQITERLREICTADRVEADDESLWLLARQGDGSMRDSQSLLDQVITFANGPLTIERVSEILGLTDRALILETLSALVRRQSKTLLPLIGKLSQAGVDPALFAADLLENIRHLLLLKVAASGTDDFESRLQLVELPDSEIRFLQDLGNSLIEEDVHLLFDMAVKTAADVSRSQDSRIVLEMGLLRMANAPRIANLEALLGGTTATAPMAPLARPPAPSAPVRAPSPQQPPAPRAAARAPHERWHDFVLALKSKDSLLAAKIEHLVFASEKNKVLELSIPPKDSFLKNQMDDKATRDKLQGFVDQHWGTGFTLQLKVATESGLSVKAVEQEKEKQKQQSVAEQVAAHPKVRAASSIFKGQIKSIKESP